MKKYIFLLNYAKYCGTINKSMGDFLVIFVLIGILSTFCPSFLRKFIYENCDFLTSNKTVFFLLEKNIEKGYIN